MPTRWRFRCAMERAAARAGADACGVDFSARRERRLALGEFSAFIDGAGWFCRMVKVELAPFSSSDAAFHKQGSKHLPKSAIRRIKWFFSACAWYSARAVTSDAVAFQAAFALLLSPKQPCVSWRSNLRRNPCCCANPPHRPARVHGQPVTAITIPTFLVSLAGKGRKQIVVLQCANWACWSRPRSSNV